MRNLTFSCEWLPCNGEDDTWQTESESASELDSEGERARERGNKAFPNAETITFQSAPRHVP